MREIITDGLSSHRRTAILEDGRLAEFIYEDDVSGIATGTIYTGIVSRILPSQFAFIDLGGEKKAFLNLNDKKEHTLWRFDESKNKNVLTIKEGMCITVQVEKEETGIKGACVTTVLSFSGKYSVLMKNDTEIGISKKIEDEKLRKSLRRLAESMLPQGYGIIMRTECANAAREDIKSEIESLIQKCGEILKKAEYTKPPHAVHKELSFSHRAVRDLIKEDNDILITNEKEFYETAPTDKKELYSGNLPIFVRYGVSEQLKKALHNKIWLDCGAFLIFDYAEACTVIDVNTGKHTGSSHRGTILKANLEAASEIALQIRLRNLSGIIIVDFIDMPFPEDRKAVTERISEEVKKDRVSVNILGMTELGLLQITRKKVGKPLYRTLLKPCPFCSGTGLIESESYIADKIKEKICAIFEEGFYDEAAVYSNKYVISSLKGDADEYRKIEDKYSKKISFHAIDTQRYDYFRIDKIKTPQNKEN